MPILEEPVDHALKGGPNIFESEGHHLLAIDSPTSGESSLAFIWWMHLDLVVPGVGVHEAEELMARSCFY